MTTIALVGANGALGQPLIHALSAAPGYKYPILVITRDASKSTSTDKVKYVQGSLEEPAALAATLKGVDVVVNISGIHANWAGLLEAVQKAGVKVYVPSEFGVDYYQFPDFNFLDIKKNHLEAARAVKGLKVVAVQNGVFGEYAAKLPGFLRLDTATNKANPINPDALFSATFLDDIAAALAVVLSKPVSEIPDVLGLSGSELTFRDYYKIYESKKGVKVEIVPAESISEARAQVLKNQQEHKYGDAEFLLYLHLLQAEEKGVVKDANGGQYVKKFKTLNDAQFA